MRFLRPLIYVVLVPFIASCQQTPNGSQIDWYAVLAWIFFIIVAIIVIVAIVYLIIISLPAEAAAAVVLFLESLWFEVIWPFLVWLFRDIIWTFLVWLFRDVIWAFLVSLWPYIKWLWLFAGGNALYDWLKSGWDWLWNGSSTPKPFYPPKIVACPSPPIVLMTSPALTATETENDYPFFKTGPQVAASATASAVASATAAALDDLQRQMASISCAGGCTVGTCTKVTVSGPSFTTIATPTPTVTPHLFGAYDTYTASATVSGTVTIQCQCK